MSKTSYTDASFRGGPRADEKVEIAGEPRRTLGVPSHSGHYAWIWDRGDDGARLRTGTYVWEGGSGDELAVPRDGDEASALIEAAGGATSVRPGASISPVPDLTEKGAEKPLAKVAEQREEIAAAQQAQVTSSPDLANAGTKAPARRGTSTTGTK